MKKREKQDSIRKVKVFDEAAFELLFRSQYEGLCFFATNYVKDLDMARELVQDAFVALWDKRFHIDMSLPVKTYLTTSIRNKCLNYLRDNKKYNKEILEFEGLDTDSDQMASDKLMQDELESRINLAIEELPEKCREVFILNRYENLKYQEIADKLEISVKTVETHMSKALKHMRDRLKDYLVILMLIMPWFLDK